jgi:drug/metabolite transporter (DMT)-like permease
MSNPAQILKGDYLIGLRLSEKSWLGLVLAVTLVLWASAFSAIPVALESFSPGHLAVARQLLSAAVTIPGVVFLWRRELLPALKSNFLPILIMGLTGITFYHLALGTGQRTVGAGAASLLINLGPIVTALLAAAILKERLTHRLIVGGLVAFLGASVLVLAGNGDIGVDWNAMLIVLAMLLQSFYFILQRKLSSQYPAVALAVLTIWVGAITLLPWGSGVTETIVMASSRSLWALVFLGCICGVVPYIGWAYVLSRLPASRASIWLYLVPPISILIGWLALNETPNLALLASGTVILLGVVIAKSKGSKPAS